VHYTPTHTSWLNQVEIWFSILTAKSLKGASFQAVEELRTHIKPGELGREITRFGDDWPRSRMERHAKLAGDDLSKRRLAETRRANKERMVKRLAPRPCRLNKNLEIIPESFLADEIRKG
jgi:hypothetical protein